MRLKSEEVPTIAGARPQSEIKLNTGKNKQMHYQNNIEILTVDVIDSGILYYWIYGLLHYAAVIECEEF